MSLGLQTRTTSYSCEKDDEDYNEASLTSRSLPWVVRVYFQSADSIKGVLCSATIIDRYWLVTSKKCCGDSENYQIIFDDENKSQWLVWRKIRHRKCVRQTVCSKMIPRADQEFSEKCLAWSNVTFCRE